MMTTQVLGSKAHLLRAFIISCVFGMGFGQMSARADLVNQSVGESSYCNSQISGDNNDVTINCNFYDNSESVDTIPRQVTEPPNHSLQGGLLADGYHPEQLSQRTVSLSTEGYLPIQRAVPRISTPR